jgi:hypothetical protein
MRRALAAFALLLAPAGPLSAQAAAAPLRFASWSPSAGPAASAVAPAAVGVDTAASPDELSLALGGVLAFFPGAVVGGFVGAGIEKAGGCDGDWCGLGGGLIGATAGTAVSIPLGVHLTNRRRGRLDRSILAAAGVAAAGWAAAFALDDGRPVLLIPFAQLVAAVAVERATTSRRGGP